MAGVSAMVTLTRVISLIPVILCVSSAGVNTTRVVTNVRLVVLASYRNPGDPQHSTTTTPANVRTSINDNNKVDFYTAPRSEK